MTSIDTATTVFWRWPLILGDVWRDSASWWAATRRGRLNEFIVDLEHAALRRPATSKPPAWVFRLVVAAADLHPRWRRQRCLSRCLLVYSLLIRSRQMAVLHFGCRVEQTGFFAHCWLTSPCQGVPARLQHPGATQAIVERTYQPTNHFLWQTSYSQTIATGPADSASPRMKSPSQAELSRQTSPASR